MLSRLELGNAMEEFRELSGKRYMEDTLRIDKTTYGIQAWGERQGKWQPE